GLLTNSRGEEVPYLTTAMPFGLSLHVLPIVSAEGQNIKLRMTATIKEFLGYDQPGNSTLVYFNGQTRSAQLPLPRFRVRDVRHNALVPDGHTIVLDGPVSEKVIKVKDKVPV